MTHTYICVRVCVCQIFNLMFHNVLYIMYNVHKFFELPCHFQCSKNYLEMSPALNVFFRDQKFQFLFFLFKACVRYFLSNFYFFTKWWSFKNYENCFLFHPKSSFRSWVIQIFVIFSLPFHTFQIRKDK